MEGGYRGRVEQVFLKTTAHLETEDWQLNLGGVKKECQVRKEEQNCQETDDESVMIWLQFWSEGEVGVSGYFHEGHLMRIVLMERDDWETSFAVMMEEHLLMLKKDERNSQQSEHEED